jgi:hypothetical protein
MHFQLEGGKNLLRPASPVKLISNFLSGSFSNSITSLSASGSMYSSSMKKSLGDVPSIQAPSMTRSNSNKSCQSVQDVDGKSSVRAGVDDTPPNPLMRLEETFAAYVRVIWNRKGNIVGKVLRNRGTADELAVNALYNSFIEMPWDTRLAEENGVDVIFVAFEKYLHMGWKDQMGQIMSRETLEALQERALRLYHGDFSAYVRTVLGDMAPQNRRAFIGLIKLLASLLEGCGNDGDRGALTVAFAELLVIDGEPHDYINLLDRLVEDSDRLFEDIGPGGPGAIILENGGNSNYGSMSGTRSNRSNTGSITSTSSSLRKKFDSFIWRQNSKSDNESRPFIGRTLSKTNRNVATGEPMTSSSLSKVSINRSRSIETPNRRPLSRDRPTILGAFDDRPTSSHDIIPRLSPIGASPPPEVKEDKAKEMKKKRRSSLSDLKSLMAAATLGENSPLAAFSPSNRGNKSNGSPRTPSPTKIPVAGGIMDRNRPTFFTGSPKQKENTPMNGTARNIGNLTERQQNVMSPPDTVIVKDLWSTTKGHSKHNSVSSIPTLRNTNRDRAPSVARPTSSPQKSPTKFRLQTSQKLRERLDLDKQALEEGDVHLQNELSKIGEEMTKYSKKNGRSGTTLPENEKLQSEISKVETSLATLRKEYSARQDHTRELVEKTLRALELKAREYDQLNKEASAENEIMWEKMNGQLGKMVSALQKKDGKEREQALVQQVKESNEEKAGLAKEVARMKREMVSLKSRLKFHE